MKSEPSTIISVLTALITAGVGLAVAFGANITDEQRNAVLAAGAALVPIIALVGPAIRQFVVSPQSAADAVVRAKQDIGGGRDVPAINVALGGYSDAVGNAGYISTPPAVNP